MGFTLLRILPYSQEKMGEEKARNQPDVKDRCHVEKSLAYLYSLKWEKERPLEQKR